MAILYPDIENIRRLRVAPTEGEWALIHFLEQNLDDSYEVFFNPYLDGDRPDFIIMKEGCAVFIIEVKDWDLQHYSITENNKWEVYDNTKKHLIASPHSQTFRYKQNLYDLHLPFVGLARLTNNNFYNLVNCFVYFHKASKLDIDKTYSPAEGANRNSLQELNRKFSQKQIGFESYEKTRTFLSRMKNNLQRDRSMSFGYDTLSRLTSKVVSFKTNSIFDDAVYSDFKRRLGPPENIKTQGIKFEYDQKQKKLTESQSEKIKIKGVAGCGKTAILAQRAVNAGVRTNADPYAPSVLILTFNITLKNYIRDRISNIQGCRDFTWAEISNYHQFFNSQITNTGQDIASLIDKYGLEKLYETNIFEDKEVIKYKTIMVDEVQDYKPGWVKIIRDNFLEEEGEMVLLGDESQDIYERNSSRAPVIAQGFGRWNELTRSYRTNIDSPLNDLFKEFQFEFLIKKYPDSKALDTLSSQSSFGFGLLDYRAIPSDNWSKQVFFEINNYISKNAMHPNDVVILSSKVWNVRLLNELFLKNENTHCMFETYHELEKSFNIEKDSLLKMNEEKLAIFLKNNYNEVTRIRRIKKNHFYSNTGLIKLSTTHSYKGLESKTVFYIMDEKDSVELIYTSITRATENLIILDVGEKNTCSPFFASRMNK